LFRTSVGCYVWVMAFCMPTYPTICTPLSSISSSVPCAHPSTCIRAGEVVVLRGSGAGALCVDGVSCVERSGAGNVPPRPGRQRLGCGMPASEQWHWGLVYSPPRIHIWRCMVIHPSAFVGIVGVWCSCRQLCKYACGCALHLGLYNTQTALGLLMRSRTLLTLKEKCTFLHNC
jgi:hypothetical protein